EPVAAGDQRDWVPRRVLEAERPVERRVAAADDHALLVEELRLLADDVVQAASLPVVDPLDPELPRLEGAVAGRDDQRAAEVRAALVRADPEQLLAVVA